MVSLPLPTTRERAALDRGSALEFVIHTKKQEFLNVVISSISCWRRESEIGAEIERLTAEQDAALAAAPKRKRRRRTR
jgi:hypothetical protein